MTQVDGHGLVDFGAPPRGKVWIVRRITVINGTPWAAGLAGSLGAVLVGVVPSNGNAVDPSLVRIPGTAIPFLATLGDMQLCVISPNHLVAAVNAGSGAEQAGGELEEVPWSATRFLRAADVTYPALPAEAAGAPTNGTPAARATP
jgi:hypothetical protein